MKENTYYKILRNIEEKQYEQIRAGKIPPQSKGWVQHLRLGFGMSLRQLGNKLGITAASAKELEQREIEGTITLQKLQQAANAFDMSLFYMFVPNSKYHDSENPLEEMMKNKSLEVARQIVRRASTTMILEDQATGQQEIDEEIQLLAKKIKQEMPRYLWD